jgi:hypothetical protein
MLKQIFYKFKFDKIDRTVINTTIANDRLISNEESLVVKNDLL